MKILEKDRQKLVEEKYNKLRDESSERRAYEKDLKEKYLQLKEIQAQEKEKKFWARKKIRLETELKKGKTGKERRKTIWIHTNKSCSRSKNTWSQYGYANRKDGERRCSWKRKRKSI